MPRKPNLPAGQCEHPRLAPIASHFLFDFSSETPLLAARLLGQSAANWQSGWKRRQALAARIALLSRKDSAVAAAEEPPPVVEEVAEPAETLSDSVPQLQPEPKQKRPKRPPAHSLDVKDATSLFASLASDSDSGLSDRDDGNGTGFGFEFHAPDEPERERMNRMLPEDDWQHRAFRDLRELPEENSPAPEIKEPEPAPKVAPTMMDLSLALLTGEFMGSRGGQTQGEGVPESEDDTTSDSDSQPLDREKS